MIYNEFTTHCLFSESKGYFVNKWDGMRHIGYQFNGTKEFSYKEVRIFYKKDKAELDSAFDLFYKQIPDLQKIVMKLNLYPEPD